MRHSGPRSKVFRGLRSLTFGLLAAACGTAAPARPPAPPGVPRLVIHLEDRSEPVTLESLDARVRIHGFLAETTLDMTFYNSEPRLLEGEFLISLPDGAVVCGYGLDVDGELVDGVVVEKDKARIVFESEAHRQVDPGIVEWAGSNLFRTRVYPILGKSRRTIRIRYAEELRFDRQSAVYRLPLSAFPALQSARLGIEVVQPEPAPRIRRHPFARLDARTEAGSFVAEAAAEHLRARSDLEIVIESASRTMLLAEKVGDETAFAVADFDPPASSVRRLAVPRNLVLFWDASLSRQTADRGRARHVVEGLLRQWRPLAVSLVVFREEAEAPRRFAVVRGRSPELLAALNDVVYDGATGWQDLELAPDFEADAVLLFSDGRIDFGSRRIPDFGVPAYVFNSAADGDPPLLRHLAESRHGAYFDLVTTTPAQVLRALRRLPATLLRVAVEDGIVRELDAPIGRPLPGSAVVTGLLAGDAARLTLVYGTGEDAEETVSVALGAAGTASGLVSRFRAQRELARLSLAPEENREALLALGRAHSLVTPWTSLIVLEDPEQYAQYEIEPPASRPEWRREYEERMAEMKQEAKDVSRDYLETLRKQWQEYLAWSRKTYDFPAPGAFDSGEPEASRWTAAEPRPAANRAPRTEERAEEPAETDPFAGRAPVPQTVRGVVTDDGGAPLPGVVIRLDSEALVDPLLVLTDEDGAYQTPTLAPGEVRITYELEGFSTVQRNFRIERGQTIRFDVELQFATVAEEILVTGEPEAQGGDGGVVLKPWAPGMPYLEALAAAPDEKLYDAYLKQRRDYATSPAFFVGAARHFLDRGQRGEALRIASNLLELGVEEPRLVRVAAHLFLLAKAWDRAVILLESLARLRPELPQSNRDLAEALILRGQARRGEDPAAAGEDFQRAASLLHGVAFEPWGPVPLPLQRTYSDDGRFEEIGRIALVEYNWALQKLRSLPDPPGPEVPEVEASWIQPPDADLRIVLTWDDEYADMDLWVIEPSGEKVFYRNPRSKIGGLLSEDCVNGLGPESYVLRHAMPGTYRILVDFYADSGPELLGPVTVQTLIVTGFGRDDEHVELQSRRLETDEDTVEIGTVTIGGAPGTLASTQPFRPAAATATRIR
jgi:Ca-activated chloride channel homolog